MPGRIQRELALLLTGKDVSWSKTVNNADRSMGKLHAAGAKAGTNMARNLERGVLVLGAVATAATVGMVNSAMDFESSSASVRKTVDGNVDAILAANRALANTTGLEVNALNEISATAGALGVNKDDVDDFTKTVAILGVTTDDVTTELGATSLGHLSTTLKLAGEDFTHLGNDLVHLGNNGASTEGQILAMTENIAGAADVMGASTPQVLGWAAALANTGEQAEAGGSSIQRFWLGSFSAVNEGGKKLELMAKISGKSAAQFKKDFGKDATGTLATFITKLGKLSKAEQLATLKALGFKDIRITRALLKLLANTDNLTESLAGAETGWKENNAATAEAQKRFETTAAKLQIFKANVNDAAITIGSKLLPVLAELSTEAVGWISEHQGDIEQFSEDLGSGVREAVKWAKSLDWEAIGSGLSIAAGAGKSLVEAFASAPPWLQGFLTTGFLANKFTGGAVGDVVGILARGLIKGVLGMNAGVVNINAGVVKGAGGIGAAGAAGAAKGGLSALSKVFLVGEAIGLVAAVIGVQQALSAESTQHATEIQDTSKVWLQQNPTTEALRSGLAAVDEGIADLQSTGGSVLVRGEALAKLQEMRADIAAQLAKTEMLRGEFARDRPGRDAHLATIAAKTSAAGLATAAAIRDKDLSVVVNNRVNVATRITGRDWQNAVVDQTIRSGAGRD